MASAGSEPAPSPAPAAPTTVKLLVAGGFGVGKTSMVAAISEVPPLRTEEVVTVAGAAVDDVDGVTAKDTTTVAMDFGRITLADDLVVYLFGTPGQDRFWFMWDELARGASGAVVLTDTRRLDASFPAVDFFERRRVPFVVGVNQFPHSYPYSADEVRAALDLGPGVPVLVGDVREGPDAREMLISLLEHVLNLDTITG